MADAPASRPDPSRLDLASEFLVNQYAIRHLLRMYQAFEGDLLACIVLGEVSHHSFSGVERYLREHPAATAEEVLANMKATDLLPTNAYSIAQSTGIPRQTVRRKVEYLVRKGWLRTDAKANLFVVPGLSRAFDKFTSEHMADFVDTARLVLARRAASPVKR
jgi:hypothetical protein